MARPAVAAAVVLLAACAGKGAAGPTPGRGAAGEAPYFLGAPFESRSISFENPTGAPGQGGKAASRLGPGRKGAPSRTLKSGETVTLCDIAGPGVIRHLWITTRPDPWILRGFLIRAYWEGQEHPSIECPLADFMGIAHGQVRAYQSAVHSVGPSAGMNFWLPMPFTRRARLTLSNEGEKAAPVFYQLDYTAGEVLPPDVGRLHVSFRRENPTTLKQDFEILPPRKGRGRFLGAVLGIRALGPDWWGEGEVKIYLDGDRDFPTICGTGSEDYVGLSWGIQQVAFLFHGCSLNEGGYVSMYRWHLPDPVVWKEDCRVTIQQIGWKNGLVERQDDWSAAAFWYEAVPSAPLPPCADVKARTADLMPVKKTEK